MTPPLWHVSANAQDQARALSHAIARDLEAALQAQGFASLAISGGRSPIPLFHALSHSPLPWARITVLLVDERCVPPTARDSNEALVREHLLRHAAARAGFVPPRLAPDHPPPPADVLVLGMGTDGHTASLFPDDPRLALALDPSQPPGYLGVAPPSSSWRRITLNLSAISRSRRVYLAAQGAAKRAVLESALAAGAAGPPVGVILAATAPRAQLYWCPAPDDVAPAPRP
ncbi:6-phosphogluconolactonase [Castellaniella hirudinis]|uniref:6-phosphogluconolactonase n=1 Tax=Castellaniella hirudinis TaxID=1144617 RepID=UPI0039C05D38